MKGPRSELGSEIDMAGDLDFSARFFPDLLKNFHFGAFGFVFGISNESVLLSLDIRDAVGIVLGVASEEGSSVQACGGCDGLPNAIPIPPVVESCPMLTRYALSFQAPWPYLVTEAKSSLELLLELENPKSSPFPPSPSILGPSAAPNLSAMLTSGSGGGGGGWKSKLSCADTTRRRMRSPLYPTSNRA